MFDFLKRKKNQPQRQEPPQEDLQFEQTQQIPATEIPQLQQERPLPWRGTYRRCRSFQ